MFQKILFEYFVNLNSDVGSTSDQKHYHTTNVWYLGNTSNKYNIYQRCSISVTGEIKAQRANICGHQVMLVN